MTDSNINALDRAKDILIKNDIRPSPVRMNVLAYMLTHKTHPGADVVYKDLESPIPTLSKTSVYNTLKLFCQKGIVKEIDIDPTYVRFDGNVDFHGHFKCNKCNEVYDFTMEEPKEEPEGFIVSIKEVYYYGICKKCAGK